MFLKGIVLDNRRRKQVRICPEKYVIFFGTFVSDFTKKI